jgi:hypothetical protein
VWTIDESGLAAGVEAFETLAAALEAAGAAVSAGREAP